MSEADEYLRKEKCPDCIRRDQPACPYEKQPKIGGGWRCRGFKSRWANERLDAAWFRRRKS